MLLRKTTIGLLAGTLMLGCVSIAYGKDAGGKIQRETHKAYDEEENQKDLYGADDAFDDADGRTQGEETEAAASSRPEDDPAALLPVHAYTLTGSVEVEGRQGVCAEGGYYWVSGSTTLAKYDKDWNLILKNESPFEGYEMEVNHIADIDVYENELYIGAEYFMDGVGKNIQIAVYDGDTLKLKRTFSFNEESGQLECSGIAVDPERKAAAICTGMIWKRESILERFTCRCRLSGCRESHTMMVISI